MNQIKGPLFYAKVLAKYNGTSLFNKKANKKREHLTIFLNYPLSSKWPLVKRQHFKVYLTRASARRGDVYNRPGQSLLHVLSSHDI